MFNKDTKIQYVNTLYEDTEKNKPLRTNLTNFFIRLGNIVELPLNKDFSEFNEEEAVVAITLLGGKSLDTKRKTVSILKSYNQWCIDEGRSVRENNALLGINVNSITNIESLKFEMISDKQALMEYMDFYLPEIDSDRICMNSIYRLCILLIFDGLTDKEVFQVKQVDIDLDGGYIHGREDKVIPISDETLYYLKKVISSHYVLSPRFGRDSELKLYDNGRVIRSIFDITSEKQLNNFRNVLSRISRKHYLETGQKIKYTVHSIYNSGNFIRLLDLEKKSGHITNDMIIDSFHINRNNYAQSKAFLRKIEDMKYLYRSWKKAFKL